MLARNMLSELMAKGRESLVNMGRISCSADMKILVRGMFLISSVSFRITCSFLLGRHETLWNVSQDWLRKGYTNSSNNGP